MHERNMPTDCMAETRLHAIVMELKLLVNVSKRLRVGSLNAYLIDCLS